MGLLDLPTPCMPLWLLTGGQRQLVFLLLWMGLSQALGGGDAAGRISEKPAGRVPAETTWAQTASLGWGCCAHDVQGGCSFPGELIWHMPDDPLKISWLFPPDCGPIYSRPKSSANVTCHRHGMWHPVPHWISIKHSVWHRPSPHGLSPSQRWLLLEDTSFNLPFLQLPFLSNNYTLLQFAFVHFIAYCLNLSMFI